MAFANIMPVARQVLVKQLIAGATPPTTGCIKSASCGQTTSCSAQRSSNNVCWSATTGRYAALFWDLSTYALAVRCAGVASTELEAASVSFTVMQVIH